MNNEICSPKVTENVYIISEFTVVKRPVGRGFGEYKIIFINN